MYCQTCGNEVSPEIKYCNRCGVQLATTQDAVVKKAEKRLDEYLDGLFWVTVLGLAVVVGGMALMQKLNLGLGFMIAYFALSSTAFLVNFWLNLREVLRITRGSKGQKETGRLADAGSSELGPMNPQGFLEAAPSITENTTRELDSIPRENLRL